MVAVAGGEYVWVPERPANRSGLDIGGSVALTFVARTPTRVRFALRVDAPDGGSDSFFIGVDAADAVASSQGPTQGPEWVDQART